MRSRPSCCAQELGIPASFGMQSDRGRAPGPAVRFQPASRLLASHDQRDGVPPGERPRKTRVFCRRGPGNRLFPKKSGFPAAFVVNRPGIRNRSNGCGARAGGPRAEDHQERPLEADAKEEANGLRPAEQTPRSPPYAGSLGRRDRAYADPSMPAYVWRLAVLCSWAGLLTMRHRSFRMQQVMVRQIGAVDP